jgi:predicted PhzF superfamily epimerase YddE/YHI9
MAPRGALFLLKHGAVVEDPGTGSACANLGGWLRVDAAQRTLVSGRVVEIGRGELDAG